MHTLISSPPLVVLLLSSPVLLQLTVWWHRFGLLFWHLWFSNGETTSHWSLLFHFGLSPSRPKRFCFCSIPPLKCHTSYLGDKTLKSFTHLWPNAPYFPRLQVDLLSCLVCPRQVACFSYQMPPFRKGSVWVRTYRCDLRPPAGFTALVSEGSADTMLLCWEPDHPGMLPA